MAKKNYNKYDNCPACGGLKRNTSRFCQHCSGQIHQQVKRQVARLVEMARDRQGQAYETGR